MKNQLAAERVLYAIAPDGAGRELILQVGVPASDEKRGWGCRVSVGFIDTIPITIYGYDAWQAIQESMLLIARRVGHYEEDGWQFYWEKDGDRAHASDLAIDPKNINLPFDSDASRRST